MDYQWKIKKNEWDEEDISAHAFFEALRVRFLCEDLLERFPSCWNTMYTLKYVSAWLLAGFVQSDVQLSVRYA